MENYYLAIYQILKSIHHLDSLLLHGYSSPGKAIKNPVKPLESKGSGQMAAETSD